MKKYYHTPVIGIERLVVTTIMTGSVAVLQTGGSVSEMGIGGTVVAE